MKYSCKFIWEKNGREQNEDALSLLHITKEGKEYLLAVVCDGIGGLPEGENASSYVADKMGKQMLLLLDSDKNVGMGQWRNAFLRKIYQCHYLLRMYGEERGIRLGTTLSMVILCGNTGWMFQVGDSAVFTGKYRLKRKTSVHRTKHGALKCAVGTGQEPKVEYKRIHVRKGKVFLIASDGFYQRTEKELATRDGIKELRKREIRDTDIDVWLRNKFRIARQRGECDNASAICVVCR